MTINTDLLASCKEMEQYMTECGYFGGKNPQYVMSMKARAAIQNAASAKETCEWSPDGDDTWNTACTKLFTFSDGDVADNGFEFCPFCGGEIFIENEGDS